MITESEYVTKVDAAHRKKFAQFFTPEAIADFMTDWVLGNACSGMHVLEPAFGLGVFSRFMYWKNTDIRVTGYDVDGKILACAKENFPNGQYRITLKEENYITAAWDETYDGIVCNPPYLKFHDYDNGVLVPIVNEKLNIHLNGFTNIYSLFLLKSMSQLRKGGRLAYIIPSEFLNSDYGVEVKRALLASGVRLHIIIVDFTKCAFDDALTTACILLCEKSENGMKEVRFSNVKDVGELRFPISDYKSFAYEQLDPMMKWKSYYEDTQENKYSHLVPFSTFAKVSRGIATGANGYFALKASNIESLKIPKKCFRPCICHAADVKNFVFTSEDFCRLSEADRTVHLFDGCADNENPHVRSYIQQGIDAGFSKRHLTANRSPWYALEKRPPAPIWVSVFNRRGLRFVRNMAGAFNLTTFHCVYSKVGIDTDVLFAYLVTDMAKEIFLDNSRQYGNGLVKFEPNDLNKGYVPDLRILTEKERSLVLRLSKKLQGDMDTCCETVSLLDDFFRQKFAKENEDCDNSQYRRMFQRQQKLKRRTNVTGSKQQNFLELFAETI